MNLIAIDPGKTTGYATFRADVLVDAGAAKKDEFLKDHDYDWPLPHVLVLIENPRWYPHDHKDVNDLLDLAVFVGELKRMHEKLGSTVELVWPRSWKGNVPKEIMTARILDRLTPDELALVPVRPKAKTPDHNCVDAIGLGLWKLGRLR